MPPLEGGIFLPCASWLLCKSTLPREFEGFDGGAASTSSIAVGHHVDRDPRLLFALRGHARTNLVDKPALKFLRSLNRSSADNQRIGIEGVHHLVEEQSEAVGLDAKHIARKFIAFFSHAAH